MMSKPLLCPVPPQSRIAAELPGADFHDCYELPDPQPQAPALQNWLQLMARTPAWMEWLMRMRNRAVGLVGLKNLGGLGGIDLNRPLDSYRVGQTVGIFQLHSLSEDEVVWQDDDRHLRVQVSLSKGLREGQPVLRLATVVHIHNRLGRVYMAVVGPAHRCIVPLMLGQVTRPQA
ncbi:hypothetical protein HNP55_000128 [Paucibacter oligotrophus]|uniref:DUF2867 domain-containing protein n=1 Tax=Roseateles oligotrophus TaxID=1769250 RepID=A0A840L464_9BURK|nr:DUF2867 domain-containing protein [Roseateles oligotrophus]MBB4841633.1 hypothetical protein [Roseateles oligotrophus]